MEHSFQSLFTTFEDVGIKPFQFFSMLLTRLELNNHPHVCELLVHSEDLVSAIIKHPSRPKNSAHTVAQLIQGIYVREVRTMASEENGSHFGASSASMQQLEEFSIEETAQAMKLNAPGLWGLLGALLGEEERLGSNKDVVISDVPEAIDNYYWDQVEAIELEGFINALNSEGALKRDIHTNRCAAVFNIKKVVLLSIMMQSMNRKSNALQSIIGIFLQSMHTPQNVVDTLARIGISISTDAIHAAVKSILMFPLQHGVTINDLKCSEELWRKSALNTQAIEQDLPSCKTWKDLLSIYPETEVTREHNLTRRDCFNAWIFLMDNNKRLQSINIDVFYTSGNNVSKVDYDERL
ncbi:hypothetical protein EV702DRAFT_1046931 [Suillus placidus]|uniref:Uncharacterized protein n=1 Tax=Suillus placidus TaxID=48579 RepID=A0A9P7D059_9AGAM|nr:hypothetical protein EV702DRAFT_1046931 [Suillus placidus]